MSGGCFAFRIILTVAPRVTIQAYFSMTVDFTDETLGADRHEIARPLPVLHRCGAALPRLLGIHPVARACASGVASLGISDHRPWCLFRPVAEAAHLTQLLHMQFEMLVVPGAIETLRIEVLQNALLHHRQRDLFACTADDIPQELQDDSGDDHALPVEHIEVPFTMSHKLKN